MRLSPNDPEKVKVFIRSRSKNGKDKRKEITVYESTVEKVYDVIFSALKRECEK